MKKTKTISFRITEDLKNKLQADSESNNQNLTDYVKSVLINLHNERSINNADEDLNKLESNIKKISFDANNLNIELTKITDNFKKIVADHVYFYEQKSTELAKNVHDLDHKLNFAINSLHSSRQKYNLIMILSIITNLASVLILVYFAFLR